MDHRFLNLDELSFEEIEKKPFNLVILSLNRGEIDTFEVGSVKLPKIPWPTASPPPPPPPPPTKYTSTFLEEDELVREILNRQPIDLSKFDDEEEDEKKTPDQVVVVPKNKQLGFHPTKFKKLELGHDSPRVQVSSNVSDEAKKNGSKKLSDDPDVAEVRRILEEMTAFDLPPMLDDLDDSCIIPHEKTTVQVSTPHETFSNKLPEEINTTNAIKRVSSTPSMKKVVSTGSSCLTDHDVEMKLEASRRKLKKQYNEIENEKKRKRIEVIEYQQPPQIAQPSKKLKKVPAKKQQTSRRPSQ